MYRLNLVLMAVLALAVIGAALFLSLEKAPAAEVDPALVQKLFRKLADPDPDVRREAEAAFRSLGPKAEPSLREASKSSDAVLARRAERLLGELRPQPAVAREEPRPETPPEPPAPSRAEPLALSLECPEPRLALGGTVHFYVRLKNEGVVPYLVARDRILRYARFARFEATDAAGRTARLRTEPAPAFEEEAPAEFVLVHPGETLDLYAGQADGRTPLAAASLKPGLYRIAFVYDATDPSPYREALKAYSGIGAPLPAVRLVSNSLLLSVAE